MKKLLITLLVIIGLAAGYAYYTLTQNPEQITSIITDEAKDAGIDVTLGSDIHFSIFPMLGVNINAVTVTDHKQLNFTADEVEVGVKIFSLFSGKIEISSIKLNNADITLTEQSKEKAPSSQEPDNTTDGKNVQIRVQPKLFSLDTLRISDSKLTLISTDGKKTIIDNTNLTIDQLNNAGTPFSIKLTTAFNNDAVGVDLNVTLNGTWTGDQMQFNIDQESTIKLPEKPSLSISTTGLITRSQDTVTIKNVLLKVDSLLVNINGQYNPNIGGEFAIKSNSDSDIAKLAKWANITLPENVSTQFALDTQINIAPNQDVTNVGTFTALGNTVTTTINITPSPLAINGRINLGDVVIPKQVSSEKNAAAAKTNPASPQSESTDTPLQTGLLKDITVNIDLVANSVKYDNQVLTNLVGKLSVNNEKLELNISRLNYAEGTLSSKVTFNNQAPTNILSGHAKLIGLNVAKLPVKQLLPKSTSIHGAAHGDIKFSSKGNSVNALSQHNLVADTDLEIQNLSIDGINLEQTLCDASAKLLQKPKVQQNWANSTPIPVFIIKTHLENEILDLKTLKGDLSTLEVSGQGTLNPFKGNLDVDIDATIGKSLITSCPIINPRLAGVAVPFECRGNLQDNDDKKLCGLDINRSKKVVAKALQDSLTDKLEDKITKKFNKWFK